MHFPQVWLLTLAHSSCTPFPFFLPLNIVAGQHSSNHGAKRRSTFGDASSPVNSKKTKLSASYHHTRRNVIELNLPPPISQEMIDRADKHITSISNHDYEQDSVATSTGDKDNAKADSSKTITPLRNHHKFVCITIDDSEDESDQMLRPATDRHESTSLSKDHAAKDELAEMPLPPVTHRQFVCITIDDDSEDEPDEMSLLTTHPQERIFNSSDNTAEDKFNEMPAPLRGHHEFLRVAIHDDEHPETPPPPYSLFA